MEVGSYSKVVLVALEADREEEEEEEDGGKVAVHT